PPAHQSNPAAGGPDESGARPAAISAGRRASHGTRDRKEEAGSLLSMIPLPSSSSGGSNSKDDGDSSSSSNPRSLIGRQPDQADMPAQAWNGAAGPYWSGGRRPARDVAPSYDEREGKVLATPYYSRTAPGSQATRDLDRIRNETASIPGTR